MIMEESTNIESGVSQVVNIIYNLYMVPAITSTNDNDCDISKQYNSHSATERTAWRSVEKLHMLHADDRECV